MTTFVQKLRRRIPLTDDQKTLLGASGIQFNDCFRGPTFVKDGAKHLDYGNSLDPGAWTPTQLRVMADVIESNPTVTLHYDGSGHRLDDPADTEIDYDLPNEV